MSGFGNFLLGAARGLEQGVEAGEYISGAIDRKKVRGAGKKYASDQKMIEQQQGFGMDRVKGAPPAASGVIQPAAIDPSKIAAPTAMAQHMPAQQPQRVRPQVATEEQQPVPAATLGVQAPTFDARFPGAIPLQMGVMGPQNPYVANSQYPQPY